MADGSGQQVPWWRELIGFTVAVAPLLTPFLVPSVWKDWQSYAVFSIVAVVVGLAVAGRSLTLRTPQGELTSRSEFKEYQFLDRLERIAEGFNTGDDE